MSEEIPVLQVKGLVKTFQVGFFRKKVEAVRGISFEVRRGEVFGLLGPNGAGKTTTIKSILRLVHPSAGEVTLFGEPSNRRETMRRVGYMPENPYLYRYLTPREFLDFAGRLTGLPGPERKKKSIDWIERVGLSHAADRPIGKFSKGMMQRVGLAQALMHEPELIILDEPMSGLDPIGRKEVLDLLMEQRRKGTTLLFTSHILSDVERLCDRVVILQKGKVHASGLLSEIGANDEWELRIAAPSEALLDKIRRRGWAEVGEHGVYEIRVPSSVKDEALSMCVEDGARVEELRPRRGRLEALFTDETSAARNSVEEE